MWISRSFFDVDIEIIFDFQSIKKGGAMKTKEARTMRGLEIWLMIIAAMAVIMAVVTILVVARAERIPEETVRTGGYTFTVPKGYSITSDTSGHVILLSNDAKIELLAGACSCTMSDAAAFLEEREGWDMTAYLMSHPEEAEAGTFRTSQTSVTGTHKSAYFLRGAGGMAVVCEFTGPKEQRSAFDNMVLTARWD